MSPCDLYESEVTDPLFLECPHCESWFHGLSGKWMDETWVPCETCGGQGSISAQDWDEID